MDSKQRIEQVAQWWTQATNEERVGLMQRVWGNEAPQKKDPTPDELNLAILLAEASAESGRSEAGEIGERLRSR